MNPALVRPGPPSFFTEVVIPINQMASSSETMAPSGVTGSTGIQLSWAEESRMK